MNQKIKIEGVDKEVNVCVGHAVPIIRKCLILRTKFDLTYTEIGIELCDLCEFAFFMHLDKEKILDM